MSKGLVSQVGLGRGKWAVLALLAGISLAIALALHAGSSAGTILSAVDDEGSHILIGRPERGLIGDDSDADVYHFLGLAGESVRITARTITGTLDPAVTLFIDPAQLDLTTGARNSLTGLDREPLAAANAFAAGDVFAAVGNGKVKRFSPTGVLLQTLDSGQNNQYMTGMGFDGAGNLYATAWNSDNVFRFDIDGNLLGAFGSGYNAHPESVAIDAAQNVYVGQADGTRQVLQFSPAGALLDTFAPLIEERGSDWIDLAADQTTLFYTSEGQQVMRYDLATKTQLANFGGPLPGSHAFALRILPAGGVIVADWESIIRLDAAGNQVQTYDVAGEDGWFAVNLDPDGTTFWSGNFDTGRVYRFNIATGDVVTSWESDPLNKLAGLAVFGEVTAAQVLNISKSAPATAQANSLLTYTISYGNSGTAAATNAIIRDRIPAGTTFVSASAGGSLADDVVSWNLGTIPAGASGLTVSFVVRIGEMVAVVVNEDYLVAADNIAPVRGAPVVTLVSRVIHDDNSGPGNSALIEVVRLPFSGRYTVLVAASRRSLAQNDGGRNPRATNGTYELAVKPVDKDSNVAAIALGNDYVNLVNTRSGQTVFSSGTGWTLSGFSPDGMTAAVALGSDYVTLVNTQSGQAVFSSGTGWSLAGFSPDGGTAALTLGDDYVNLVSTESGQTVFSSGTGWRLAAFSPDSRTAAVALGDDYVTLVNTETGQAVFSGGTGWSLITFSPDGGTAAIALGTDYVNLIDCASGQTVFSSGTGWTLNRFSPDGSTAAISLGSDYVDLINTSSGQLVYSSGTGWTLAGFSADSGTAVIALGNDYVNLVNTVSGQTVHSSGTGWTLDVLSPDGETVAIALGTDYVNLIDAWTGQTVFSSGTGWQLAAFSPDGGTAAVSLGTDYVNLVDTESGQTVFSSGTGWNLAGFSPDGRTAAIALGTDYVNLVDARGGQTVYTSGTGWRLAGFSPDGGTAAMVLGDDYVNLVNCESGQTVFSSGTGWALTAFSPDGATAAISLGDDYVNLVNTETGQTLASSGTGWTLTAFSLDSDTVAISLGTDYVHLLDARSGRTVFSSGTGWTLAGFTFDRTSHVGVGSRVSLPLVVRNLTATVPGDWVTLAQEDFEGGFPAGWEVLDDEPGEGEYYWAKRTCRPFNGSFSGWAVGGGADGAALACGSNYPDYADSWMIFGPFSLADASAAELTFWAWLNAESDYDVLFWGASTDGFGFYGQSIWESTDGWQEMVLDLTNVPTLGNLAGQSQVWVALLFVSDFSINLPEGAYVDDILLRKYVGAGGVSLPLAPAGGGTPAYRMLAR